MRHLDQQRQGVVRVVAQGVVERLEVELADLGGELGERRELVELGPPGRARRRLALT
ncbi:MULTISPECIES: hypothetical protein [unclassified Nocardioides]|uniref:hypothetical protein n=1 Tax=unclassified Nocardioides TaxID=2615069 RepID=UPI000B27AF9C|nr:MULTISPECIES: hypothetical protein [unclassified Nocardioides]